MKPTKTKAEIRQEIAAQVDAFINQGGAVDAKPPGASGRDIGDPLPPLGFDKKPEAGRTPVPDVVRAIEERRKPAKPLLRRTKRPRKILLRDDFGEPIRWVWSED